MDLRDAIFNELILLADTSKDVFILSADMGATELDKFKAKYPKQFVNVGISEQNLINVAAGMAMEGKRIYVYTIAAFLIQRALEQIKVNLCAMKLPVTLIGIGGGMSYSYDGLTHHIPQDIGILNTLPNIEIFVPFDESSMRNSVHILKNSTTPRYIRLDKGIYPDLPAITSNNYVHVLRQGRTRAVLTYGTLTHEALDTFPEAGCICVERLKPLDEGEFLKAIKPYQELIVYEEHSKIGGLASIVASLLLQHGLDKKLNVYAFEDEYCNIAGDRIYINNKFLKKVESNNVVD
jgi:transketolase